MLPVTQVVGFFDVWVLYLGMCPRNSYFFGTQCLARQKHLNPALTEKYN